VGELNDVNEENACQAYRRGLRIKFGGTVAGDRSNFSSVAQDKTLWTKVGSFRDDVLQSKSANATADSDLRITSADRILIRQFYLDLYIRPPLPS